MRCPRCLVLLLSGLGLVAFNLPVRAGGLVDELKIGVLAHDVPDLWSNLQAERDGADVNVEAIFSPSIRFLGGTIRPALGASISTRGDTSNVYLDARWQLETALGVFLGLGVGGTVHDGQLKLEDWSKKALGSRVLFHIPVEVGYRFDAHDSLSVYFEHMSNGYLASPNEGMDRIGLRYGYRF